MAQQSISVAHGNKVTLGKQLTVPATLFYTDAQELAFEIVLELALFISLPPIFLTVDSLSLA